MKKYSIWAMSPWLRYTTYALSVTFLVTHSLRIINPPLISPGSIGEAFSDLPAQFFGNLNQMRLQVGDSVMGLSESCATSDYETCREILESFNLLTGLAR
ncbi:MAG: hypothetical protein PHC51_02695 [bacterium]|nr:hypothetical protein [bacterium]